jgi:hypothetical protein
MSDETTQKTFTVSGVPAITIGNVRGLVTVQPGADGEVSVTAVKHAGPGSSHTSVEMEQGADGHITIKTRHGKFESLFFFLHNQPARVDYTVSVPQQVNLTVKSVACDVDVRGLTGDVTLKNVSGSLVLADLSGSLSLETVSGRIAGGNIRGALALKTVSGRASLTNSHLPQLTAASVSGSLELDTPLGAGPYHLKTVSGNATIRMPEASGGTIHFKSISGCARVDGQRARTSGHTLPGGPRRETYYLPGDGPVIDFSSVSGSLRLLTPGGGLPAAQPAQPASQLDILERLARGELSVEDAVQLMRA